ncbi:hypothetical protein FRB90_001082, partial [Tulasnella sp. 427]
MSRRPLGNPASANTSMATTSGAQASVPVEASLAQKAESVKAAIVKILNDTTWPRRSTSIVQEFVRSLTDVPSLADIPQDESGISVSARGSLQNCISVMETVQVKLDAAADTYGETNIFRKFKNAIRSSDKKCSVLLQECQVDAKAALSSLPLSNECINQPASTGVNIDSPAQPGDSGTVSPPILPPQPAVTQGSIGVVSNHRAPSASPAQPQPAAPSIERPTDGADRGKLLGAMKGTFDMVEGVSGTLPIVGSFFSAAAKVGKIIVQTIQNMDSNESACVELEAHASRLSTTLDTFHKQPAAERKEKMSSALDEVQRALQDLRTTAADVSSANTFKKALFADGNAESLKGQKEKLQTALEVMQLLVHLNTAKLVAEQHDAEGLKEQRRLLNCLGDAEYGLRGTSINDVICLPGTRVATLDHIDA